MDWYEPEVRDLEKTRVAHSPPAYPAVFYGSSSIRMWTTLALDLGSPRAVNLGFGGSTLEACVRFFERLVLPIRLSSLVVYAGDNDLGDGRSPGEVARWFEELIAKVDRDLFDGYYDQDVYFQTPSHFIPNLIDSHALDSLRRLEITLAVGDTDPFCENTRQLSGSLWEKGVPNRLDLWKGEAHCAREWRQMVPVYL